MCTHSKKISIYRYFKSLWSLKAQFLDRWACLQINSSTILAYIFLGLNMCMYIYVYIYIIGYRSLRSRILALRLRCGVGRRMARMSVAGNIHDVVLLLRGVFLYATYSLWRWILVYTYNHNPARLLAIYRIQLWMPQLFPIVKIWKWV